MGIQKRTTKTGKITWIARYRDPNGQEHSKSFPTQREAKYFLTNAQHDINIGKPATAPPKDLTVGRLWDMYCQRPMIRESSRQTTIRLGKSLHPLRDIPVAKLNKRIVQDWYYQIQTHRDWVSPTDQGLSTRTAKTILTLFLSCLRWAVDQEILAHNPVPRVKMPATTVNAVTRKSIPTISQVHQLIAAAEQGIADIPPNPLLAAMLRTAAGSGLRIGELCGLNVGDIDFLRREISVERQFTGAYGLRPPKTRSSIRVVPVAEDLLFTLDPFCAGRAQDAALFTGARGARAQPTVASHNLAALARVVGLQVSFHTLRHFYASLLIAHGVPVSGVQHALGHASAAMTLEVYTHFWPGAEEQTRAAVTGLFGSGDCGISAGSASS